MRSGAHETKQGCVVRDNAFGNPEGPDGEPASQSLCPGYGVGDQAGFDAAPPRHFACPPETTLDFIKKKEEIMLLAEFLNALQELAGGQMDSALTLDRFKQDRTGLWPDVGGQGGQIIQFKVAEAGEERVKALLHLFLAGSCDTSEGAPVKGFVEGQDLVPGLPSGAGPGLSEAPCQFDEPIVGFRSRVAEKDPSGQFEAFINKAPCEFDLLVNLVEITAMDQLAGLPGDRAGQGGVAMSEGAGGKPGAEVQIAVSVLVP